MSVTLFDANVLFALAWPNHPDHSRATNGSKVTFRSHGHPDHAFFTDDIGLVDKRFVARHTLQGYRQITDVYLIEPCVRHGGRLATFDKGVASYAASAGISNVVILIQ